MTTVQSAAKARREKNQLAARQSRQRRMAYILQLELSLKHATERIRSLESELHVLRAESIVTEGCMLSQALIDPMAMGTYPD